MYIAPWPPPADTTSTPEEVAAWLDSQREHLPPTVPPPVLDDVGGRPVVTPTLRPGLL